MNNTTNYYCLTELQSTTLGESDGCESELVSDSLKVSAMIMGEKREGRTLGHGRHSRREWGEMKASNIGARDDGF